LAVSIRLRRMGSKKKPFYRVVAIDSRKAREGAYLENLGTYAPLLDKSKVELKKEEIISWLEKGAQPSQTVKDILKREGVWSRFKGVNTSDNAGAA